MAYTATLLYDGDLRTTVTHLQSGSVLHTDAPTDNQGKGENFSPTDLVAVALATCIVTTMGILAQRIGLDIRGTRADMTKVMSSEPPRKIARLLVNVILPAGSYSAEDRTRLERAGRHCPVRLSLHPDIEDELTFVWPD